MSRVRERPSTSEAHNDFWCGMSGVHAGGDAKLLIKFAWPKVQTLRAVLTFIQLQSYTHVPPILQFCGG